MKVVVDLVMMCWVIKVGFLNFLKSLLIRSSKDLLTPLGMM